MASTGNPYLDLPAEIHFTIFDHIILAWRNRVLDLDGPKPDKAQDPDTLGHLLKTHLVLSRSIKEWYKSRSDLIRVGRHKDICPKDSIFCLDLRWWSELPYDTWKQRPDDEEKWKGHQVLKKSMELETKRIRELWEQPSVLEHARHILIRIGRITMGDDGYQHHYFGIHHYSICGKGFGGIHKVLRALPKLPNLQTIDIVNDPLFDGCTKCEEMDQAVIQEFLDHSNGLDGISYNMCALWCFVWEIQGYCKLNQGCTCCPVPPQIRWGVESSTVPGTMARFTELDLDYPYFSRSVPRQLERLEQDERAMEVIGRNLMIQSAILQEHLRLEDYQVVETTRRFAIEEQGIEEVVEPQQDRGSDPCENIQRQ